MTRRAPALGVIFPAGDTLAQYWLGSGLLIFSFFFDFLMFGEIFREVLTIQKTGPLAESQLQDALDLLVPTPRLDSGYSSRNSTNTTSLIYQPRPVTYVPGAPAHGLLRFQV